MAKVYGVTADNTFWDFRSDRYQDAQHKAVALMPSESGRNGDGAMVDKQRGVIVRAEIKRFAEGMERRARAVRKMVNDGKMPHYLQMKPADLLAGAKRNLAHFDPERPQLCPEEADRQAQDVANYLVFYLQRRRAEA